MRTVLLVGVGGFVGSVARHLLGGWVQHRSGGTFPTGTLMVNVTGCLVLGLLAGLADARAFLSPGSRALLIIGLLGGFTTFSAFGNETYNMLADGDRSAAGLNVVAHIVLGIGAIWLGRAAAFWIWR